MSSQNQMMLEKKSSFTPTGFLQRKCDKCKKKELLQRRSAGQARSTEAPPIVHEVLRSPGQSLDHETRAFMEPRFGHDFSRVQVHADDRANESARSVNALAYTVGNNIVFGEGQYRPWSVESRKLIAHELSHVIQQRDDSGLARASISMGPSGDAFEAEASNLADRIVSAIPLGYPIARMRSAKLYNMLQRQSNGCPPEGVIIEEKHAGLCTDIEREAGELEEYSNPVVDELTPSKCYLLWSLGNDSARFGDLPKLNEIAELFSQDNDPQMSIDGYTDCIRRDKDPKANEQLRWKRAYAVRDYFVNVKKLDKSRIAPGIYQNDIYIDHNTSPKGRARNRSAVINLALSGVPKPQKKHPPATNQECKFSVTYNFLNTGPSGCGGYALYDITKVTAIKGSNCPKTLNGYYLKEEVISDHHCSDAIPQYAYDQFPLDSDGYLNPKQPDRYSLSIPAGSSPLCPTPCEERLTQLLYVGTKQSPHKYFAEIHNIDFAICRIPDPDPYMDFCVTKIERDGILLGKVVTPAPWFVERAGPSEAPQVRKA